VYGGAAITDCTFENGGGGWCDGSNPGGNQVCGAASIVRCVFRDNHDIDCSCIAGAGLIDECLFEDNDQMYGASVRTSGIIRNSTFRRNFTNSGAADVSGAVTIEHCVFFESREFGGWGGGVGGAVAAFGRSSITNCTFVRMLDGAAIDIRDAGAVVEIRGCLVAFGASTDPPVACTATPSSLTVTCTNMFGNAAGDWVGCIAGMEGLDGNLSADPLFCSMAGEDYRLHAESPCAPANSGECGLIGALDVGCGATAVETASWGAIKALYR
jgi:hypothetical protein